MTRAWLQKGPPLRATGWLLPWPGDAVFVAEDHFMLLSMFNLYRKPFSSKRKTPAETSKGPVNQKS